MEAALKKGCFLAGFFSYEAGYAFEKKLFQKDHFDFPLLNFGIYHPSKVSSVSYRPPIIARQKRRKGIEQVFNLDYPRYKEKIKAIRSLIAQGETYQITFCVKSKFRYADDPKQLYQELLDYQPVPYPAYLDCGEFQIMSLSPEMFLKSNGRTITVKPMKGTLFRDGSLWNNLTGKHWLHHDPKNRAENIMICDLLRNDLGRICHTGTVKTTKIYEVAKYRTVYQMTSTVRGDLREKVLLYELFAAVFPSGSVTGTPKIRAMQIIRDLEEEERRIYTGAIGFISPTREAFFNVPIRTILLRKAEAEMGIGGGITYYSTPEGEYDECLVKALFLSDK
ncbi:MAG: chorismate-binding protein [Candidatus Saganbacteria bacterium]|nr:chorismate-binding protein [Candidatus Saganbacteria bacterium]